MIALLRRDLMLAFRAGGGFGLGLAFFLIVTVLVPFSVGPQPDLLGTIAPGVLWLGALLACLLSLDRLLALDYEDGTLDLLATAPLPLEAALSAEARTEAEAAGAVDIHVTARREVKEAQAEARRVFLEAEIVVEASGRPRIAS